MKKKKIAIPRTKNVFASLGKPLYWTVFLFVAYGIYTLVRSITSIPKQIAIVIQQASKKFSILNFQFSKRAKKKKSKGTQRLSFRPIQLRSGQTPWRNLFQNKRKKKQPSKIIPKDLRPRGFLVRHALVCSIFLFTFAAFALGGGYVFYEKILKDLPTPTDLVNHHAQVTTKIYDRNHNLLYKIYKNQNRSLVTLSDVPQYFLDATISIEDKEFYTHHGFDIAGILRALRNTLLHQDVQGGSTITQQLVKNTLLTPEKTVTRKIKELILAIQVEQTLSKNEILQMYINEVPYGGTVYGVEEASEEYFGIHAKDLSLAQATFLAGLPAAPSAYSPNGNGIDLAIERQHEVLRRMVEDKKITPIQASEAEGETLTFAKPGDDIKAPHFVMYIKDLLVKEFGEGLVSQGGLEVTTSLDLPLQEHVEQIVHDEVASLHGYRVSNGAALVTNPNTGAILAMVGSQNYFDTKNNGQVNVTLRPRQPGSSIKPLMYSAALDRGFTPATILDDSPIVYTFPGGPPYAPKNYDGTFHGKEELRTALASSHNVPAVKTEATIGLSAFINQAQAMGISTWDDTSRFGLSLTLGSGEVLMTDMATAYGVFPNQGMRVDLNPILDVRTPSGEVLYHNPCSDSDGVCNGTNVLDPRIAYQITNILSDNNARAKAFGTHSVLFIPNQEVAVKTGTTNSLRDNWTFGYTTNRLVSTWVGNNNNEPMSNIASGVTGASPMWNKIMQLMLDNNHPNHFPVPDGLVTESICPGTGQPSCGESCGAYTEYFLPGTAPAASCNSQTAVLPSPTPSPKEQPKLQVNATRDQILSGVSTDQ
ncbi:penicillin-binding protein [Candidatus Cerribacteria bacterium 'Amazon FNV 2010 28 9']|uniref:Penicillin-binding protein n=1 Tax=Candidatus Cerribacteria bacterium 'Amazon FNV 2010 28 9' TaxID=2081795 RepID=A0A317JPT2_9BACT|nr:MAG: penicillin-binding protein [Candidatus Cerribacteria bacterium 'Amazon FNV 2010 28 9']